MKNRKYPNLLAEMARKGDTKGKICEVLGIKRTTLWSRLNGEYQWKQSEIDKLCERYNKSYDELFKKESV